jgi:enterochelin esterase-like enzyme
MEGNLVKTTRIYLSLILLGWLGLADISAQIPNRPLSVSDTLQTVEVGSDNRVTFRLYAPKASTVTVSGDFLLGAPPADLVKGNDGVWSFTSNPIPPDSYTYNFTVDGVMVLDSRNPNFRENPNALFNFFDMLGPETDFMALRNVPHGRVESVIYHSSSLNMERRIHVYLPPNFENIKSKLPVLYLLHGGGDNDISWTSAGKVNLILDNLYAEQKLKNMIVIMPSGHVPGHVGSPMLSPVDPDVDSFSKDFLNDLMPFVEKTYPVSSKREDRAIAGFSMGGVQTLNLALWHPEKFAYVFPMSTGYFPDGIKQIDEEYSGVMRNVTQHPFKQFIIGRGKDDKLTEANNQATLHMLDKYSIQYKYQELNGTHSFVFSRRFLASIFPLLFR